MFVEELVREVCACAHKHLRPTIVKLIFYIHTLMKTFGGEMDALSASHESLCHIVRIINDNCASEKKALLNTLEFMKAQVIANTNT